MLSENRDMQDTTAANQWELQNEAQEIDDLNKGIQEALHKKRVAEEEEEYPDDLPEKNAALEAENNNTETEA